MSLSANFVRTYFMSVMPDAKEDGEGANCCMNVSLFSISLLTVEPTLYCYYIYKPIYILYINPMYKPYTLVYYIITPYRLYTTWL